MPETTHQRGAANAEFEALFAELTRAWSSHQRLKTSDAPLADVASSNADLFRARVAMGRWRLNNGI